MSTPYVAPKEPFPIAAAVAGGMVVVIFAAIIVLYSYTQRRRRNPNPVGDVETAEAGAVVNPRGPLRIVIVDPPGRQKRQSKGVEPSPYSGSRKDGSTIYVSSPSGEAE
ncbi:hypothetical protein MSAN_01587500 [Mycena sanguinolenta]|uniref:Uncharacterized protein n=1 Tax=Mycena sanguinolenta TaxID=230812 RepID=A0A8H7CV92_9AGAR|nr:hypothetical protein MSAN_01587500 [Mycena sanguinolenta]